MVGEMMIGFLGSARGRQVVAALAARGMAPREARRVLTTVAIAATQAMAAETQGHPEPRRRLFELFGGDIGRALAERVSDAIVRRDGLVGTLGGGELGRLRRRIGDAVARSGLPRFVSDDVAAVVTPFLARHAHETLG